MPINWHQTVQNLMHPQSAALASRPLTAPDYNAVSPPELPERKRALQDDIEALGDARSKLIGAHEVLNAYQNLDDAELLLDIIERLSDEINDLEDRINEP